MPVTRHVALLIEASLAYAHGVIRGVAQYNQEHAHWAVYFEPHALDDPPPKWLKSWKGDGILARIGNRRIAKAVLAVGAPVVDLRRVISIPGIPSIGPDNYAVARLAAEHLRERGFRHFGFCGLPRGLYPPLFRPGELSPGFPPTSWPPAITRSSAPSVSFAATRVTTSACATCSRT